MNANAMYPTAMQWLAVISGYGLLLVVGGFGLAIIWRIWRGEIDLTKLISEPNGDASTSRLQFLIFTFVIALSLFLVIVGQTPPKFPEVIPATVMALLGISGSSYLVSKGIQFSDPAGIQRSEKGLTITPGKPVLHVGQTQQFKAELSSSPDAAVKVKWEVLMGYGTITADGLYTADLTKGPATTPPSAATPPVQAAATPPLHATVQATVEGEPDLSDLAVVTILA
jgi:hypothetical protein